MKRFSRMLAVAALVSSAGHAATAQEVCTPADRERIVTLSQTILDQRLDLGRFQAPRFGTSAAYFLYHYGGMTDAAALAMFTRLGEGERPQKVFQADDMAAALAVYLNGPEAGLRLLNEDTIRAFADAYWPLQRAILEWDNGASYFAFVDVILTDPAYDRLQVDMRTRGMSLAFLVRDLPEAQRIEMARQAEAYDQWWVAPFFYADLDDGFEEFEAFVARQPVDEADENAFDFGRLVEGSLMGEPSDGRYMFELRVDRTDQNFSQRFSMARAMTANNRLGSFGWLATFMNLTGREVAAGRAANAYLAQVGSGAIDPWADLEGAWLYMYRALRFQPDAGAVQSALIGFDVSPIGTRHFAGRALETIETMMVLEALTQDVTPDPQIVDHPLLLRFAPVLEDLRADPASFTPADELEAKVAVDVLWRAGQRDAAVAWAEIWLGPQDRLTFYRDVASRLDMTCDGVLAYPGRALYQGGQPFFRFPPVVRSEWDQL